MMRKNIGQDYQKYAKVADVGSHLGASCVVDSRASVFVSRPIFRNLLGVPPWTDFGLPWGTLRPTLLTFCKI